MNLLEHHALRKVKELLKQARFEISEAQKHPQGEEAANTRAAGTHIDDAKMWVGAILDNMVERSYDGG